MKVSITDQHNDRTLLSHHVIDDPATMVFQVKQILESRYPKEYPLARQILWLDNSCEPILEEEGSCDQRASRIYPNLPEIGSANTYLEDTKLLLELSGGDESMVDRQQLNDSRVGLLSPVNMSLRTPTNTSSASIKGARQNNSVLGIFSPKSKTPKRSVPTTASRRQFTQGVDASFSFQEESFERGSYPLIRLKVSLNENPVNLNLMVVQRERKRTISFEVFESTSVFTIKLLAQKHLRIPLEIQVLSFMRHSLDNSKTMRDCLHCCLQTPQQKTPNIFNFQLARRQSGRNVMDHNFKSSINFLNKQPEKLTLTLTVLQRVGGSKFNIGIDLTFNAIKHVRKIGWKKDAPDYRDVDDGLCWCCYCMEPRCRLFKELFMIKKGYGTFNLLSEYDHRSIRCPVCRTTNVQVRNMGFVKCEWAIKACYREGGNLQSFIGKTYDNRLHTLKESNLREVWKFLEVNVNVLPRGTCQNKDPGSALKIQDILNIWNLPSLNGDEAQTAARKILFQDISIVPKVNSNPPSPEPEGPFLDRPQFERREGPRAGPMKIENERIGRQPSLGIHGRQNQEILKIEGKEKQRRGTCSCEGPDESGKCGIF